MAKSPTRAICAALAFLGAGAPAAGSANSAPLAGLHPQNEAAADLHILARFIQILLRYSSAGAAEPADKADFKVCLTEAADASYSLHDLQNLAVRNWRIDVDIVPSPASLSAGCHLAFIAKNEVDAVDYSGLTQAGVLTVSDSYDFAKKGGVVEVEFQKGRIAFYIGYDEIRKTALSPSSKFLRLATDVYR